MKLKYPLLSAALASVAWLGMTPAAGADTYSTPMWIAKPANDATIHNATGNLGVSVALGSPLDASAGDYVQLLLDGEVVADSSDAQHFKLHDVPLGRHTLEADLRSGRDHALLRSAPIVVDMTPPRG
jgi:hypothetical protein